MGRTLFFLALFIVPTWWILKKDYKRGFFIALCLLCFMTSQLAISAGPAELTFTRAMLMVLTLYWWLWHHKQKNAVKPLYVNFMKFWVAMVICSTLFSQVLGDSIKWAISFLTEVALFYAIVATSIQDEEDFWKAWKAICTAVAIAAVIGTYEYYRYFNPVNEWMGVANGKTPEETMSTFQHRILFGYASAMGWPLLLIWAYREQKKNKQRLLVGLSACALACCYFTNSRGAWFGSAIDGALLYFLGTPKIRKTIVFMMVMAAVVIVVRPGVRSTVVDLVMSTFDPTSYRGGSYYYRKELWPMAFKLAAGSPARMLFGCGPLALEHMDLSDKFVYGGSTHWTGFSSWDNNLAADFAEFGYLGYAAQIMFYGAVLVPLARFALRGPSPNRDLMAGIIAAMCVYLFALTNVYMFSPQLKCIFLTLAAMGARLVAFSKARASVTAAPNPPLGQKPRGADAGR